MTSVKGGGRARERARAHERAAAGATRGTRAHYLGGGLLARGLALGAAVLRLLVDLLLLRGLGRRGQAADARLREVLLAHPRGEAELRVIAVRGARARRLGEVVHARVVHREPRFAARRDACAVRLGRREAAREPVGAVLGAERPVLVVARVAARHREERQEERCRPHDETTSGHTF